MKKSVRCTLIRQIDSAFNLSRVWTNLHLAGNRECSGMRMVEKVPLPERQKLGWAGEMAKSGAKADLVCDEYCTSSEIRNG